MNAKPPGNDDGTDAPEVRTENQDPAVVVVIVVCVLIIIAIVAWVVFGEMERFGR